MSEGTGANYEQLYAEFSEEYSKSEPFQRWAPPTPKAGEALRYDVQVSDVKVGQFADKKNGGKMTPYTAAYGRILSGEFEGKEFQLYYFTPKSFGSMKSYLSVTCDGMVPPGLEAAFAAVAASKTMFLRVSQKLNPKNGFVNTYTDEKLVIEDAK